MSNIASLFSLLFFSLLFVYLSFGIYIIKLNSRASINKVFLAICVSMSIWSFAFGMANLSQNVENVLFWRRVSAVGWASLYSIMLHFFILLSHKNMHLKGRILLSLLHIPALVNMYVFSFSNKLTALQYNLVKIEYGWINKSINNGWDWFFNFYYVTYVLLTLFFIWKWQKDLKDRKASRHAKILVGSLFASFIMGSLTNIVFSSMGIGPFPQMAPVFILFPTWAIYHSARYHGAINYGNEPKKEIIVTEEVKQKLFHYISVAFVIAGVFNFTFEYSQYLQNSDHNLKLGILKSIMFLITGVLLYAIQRIKKENLRESLTILILVSNIPMITLNFLRYAGMTIWVFPMIIIIASLVFSKRRLLISTVEAVTGTKIEAQASILVPVTGLLVPVTGLGSSALTLTNEFQ